MGLSLVLKPNVKSNQEISLFSLFLIPGYYIRSSEEGQISAGGKINIFIDLLFIYHNKLSQNEN